MAQAVSICNMFQDCELSADLSAWRFENLINIRGAFKDTTFSNLVHLGAWNTSTVVDFSNAFERTVPNQALGLHNWDTRSGVLFDQCFDHALVLDDISHWNTGSAQSWSRMFYQAKFKNPNLDLSGWDAGEVRDFHKMFQRSNFQGNISSWMTHKALDLRGMFWDCPFHGDLSTLTIRTDQIENMLDPLHFDKFKIPNVALWHAVLKNDDFEDRLQPHLRAHLVRTRPIVEGLIDTPLARAQEVHRLYGLERAYERSQAIPMPELTIS